MPFEAGDAGENIVIFVLATFFGFSLLTANLMLIAAAMLMIAFFYPYSMHKKVKAGEIVV